ncbi:hypothetical protein Q427_11425 [Halomonas sp. BC04]|nr:hypothetical protein Q427_11425 [Halomonas sp. BC04]
METLGLVVDDVGRSQLMVEGEVLGGLGRRNGKTVDQIAAPGLALEHQGKVDVG